MMTIGMKKRTRTGFWNIRRGQRSYKDLAEIKTDGKKSEMEDPCGSLMFRGRMKGSVINRSSGSEEIPSLYGTQRFIIMFTRARHLLPT